MKYLQHNFSDRAKGMIGGMVIGVSIIMSCFFVVAATGQKYPWHMILTSYQFYDATRSPAYSQTVNNIVTSMTSASDSDLSTAKAAKDYADARTDSKANWDTAYADRLKWDGGATGLTPATGRTSLELGTAATTAATDYATAAQGTKADSAYNDTAAATDASTASTLAKRDSSGKAKFRQIELDGDVAALRLDYSAAPPWDIKHLTDNSLDISHGTFGQALNIASTGGAKFYGPVEATGGLGVNKTPANGGLDVSGNAAISGDLFAKNHSLYRGGGLLINGDMSVCQRQLQKGLAIATTLDSARGYSTALGSTLDCWYNSYTGSGVADTVRQYSFQSPSFLMTDTPRDNPGYSMATNYMEIENALLYPTVAAGAFINMLQSVESQNVLPFANQEVTISFWAQCDSTMTFSYGIRNALTNKSWVNTADLTANTWAKITDTITLDTYGTLGAGGTGRGIIFAIALMAGSTFTTPNKGQWTNGNMLAGTGQNNFASAIGRKFRVTNIKLEPGSIASPFCPESYATNFDRCVKRYERQWQGGTSSGFGTGFVYTSGTLGIINLKYQPKRVVPTSILMNGAFVCTGSDFSVPVTGVSSAPSISNAIINCTISGGTAGHGCGLYAPGATGSYIEIIAELL